MRQDNNSPGQDNSSRDWWHFNLKDLIEIEQWQKIQDSISEITEVGLLTLDANGKLLTKPSFKPRLCTALLQDAVLREECLPTFLGGKAVVDKNLSFVCIAGLHNFIVPIKCDDQLFGYLVIGPVILVKRKQKEEYLEAADKLRISLDDFWNALLEIKVVSFQWIQSEIELVKNIAGYILKVASRAPIMMRQAQEEASCCSSRLNKLLSVLLDVALQTTGADLGSIMLLDRRSDELKISVSRGIDDDIARKTVVKPGEGISGTCLKEERPFLINDYPIDRQDNRIKRYLQRPYLSSAMVIPIKMEERVIGVINLAAFKTSSLRFTAESLRLVEGLVELAAVTG